MGSTGTNKTKKLQADVVVMGSGGGLAAAVAAAEEGASVILLEKENVLGGYTRQANGIGACGSPAQKRRNINVTVDRVFKTFISWDHWYKINPRVIRAYLEKTGDTIRWLEEKGVEFEVGGFGLVSGLTIGHMPVGMGAAIQKALIKSAKDLGVITLINTSGKRILRGPKGNVTGAVAVTKDGEEIQIETESVIIATGGFGNNRELLKKHCPDYYDGMILDQWPHREAHSGDGLIMAEEIGAALSDSVPIYHIGPHYYGFMYPWQNPAAMALSPYGVWVNKKGKRFITESGYEMSETETSYPQGISTHHQHTNNGNAILMQPDKVMFAIFDDEIRSLMEEGRIAMEKRLKQAGPGGGTKTLEKGLPGLKVDLQKQARAKDPATKIADSWDEIAAWIGADPAVLKAEIAEYNSFCEKGYDEIFLKEPRFLHPLRRPPYYAMRCYARVGETMGGIKVNEHMEVLDTQGNVIPGAYVGCVIADGWNGQHSCHMGPMGFTINVGRIAGENAARYVKAIR
jgi:fumarate reductase flavoprotein subunit